MKLNEQELFALLSGLNLLSSKEENLLQADVNLLYHKIEEAYYNAKRIHHYECDI
tara:strand:+ start:385 stop:549 length:165 start_codon:yes stop_codon:yes gene_type:complete